MTLKIGINGFGRIGRLTFRALMEKSGARVVAINDLTDSKTLAHLLRYDSVYGTLPSEVYAGEDNITVDGEKIRTFQEREPSKIPWGEYGVDVVLESTGIFRSRREAAGHLEGGAARVIVSAPMKDPDLTVVLGVNEADFQPAHHHVVSNASCTTNALAPVIKVLHDNFGVQKALINTTHAYTNDQQLLDFPHTDLRRGRAALLSLIPTSTGAARAVGEVIPALKGRIDGFAVRVPTPTVSLLDIVAVLEKMVDVEQVNKALQLGAAEIPEILGFSNEPLVSMDYRRSPHSSVVDGLSTMVTGENMVRVVTWYDNEWSYACRMADLALYMQKREQEEVATVGGGAVKSR